MAQLIVLLYSKQQSQRITYTDSDGVMTEEIHHTYLRKCRVLDLRHCGARILVCTETREALSALEKKYEQATGFHIRKLLGFLSKLTDGDCFYYFSEEHVSTLEKRVAWECLQMEKLGYPWCASLHNKIFEHFSFVDLRYQFLSYGHDGLVERVGEPSSNNRVCRFCGKSMPEVSFKNVAHAVQDALGNKLLFCYEECDDCNHNLAPVENEFRVLMDFRRSIYRIPRKETSKAAKVVGKDFILLPDAEGDPQLYIMKEALAGKDLTRPFVHHFELKEPVVNEQIYKALCKMVIDMLPSSELSHFKNTVCWIVSDKWLPDTLPSIWLGLLPNTKPMYKQPALDIFINNKGVLQEAPYCTAIIWICDVAYLFVVPFVDKDAGRYKKDEQLLAHIRNMIDWTGMTCWYKQDTMGYHLSASWVNWQVDPHQSYVHILHKTDPVFEECEIKQKAISAEEEIMPDVKPDYLTLGNIEYVKFKAMCKEPLVDDDLKDVTVVFDPVIFTVNAADEMIDVKWHVEAYDTTYTQAFFSYEFSVSFQVSHFKDFVKVGRGQDGELSFFSFHYQLSYMLFEHALAAVTSRMQEQQKGTVFEERLLTSMPSNSERILARSEYHIPIGNQYLVIYDSQIHGVGYE